MPQQLPHRELRNRSAEILREVQAGTVYEITNHGKVVAVLMPARDGLTMSARPARKHGGFAELARRRRDTSTADVLADLRGER